MKLIIAVVQDKDANRLITALINDGYGVTKLSTTGGFLRSGNTTLMIGSQASKLDQAMDVIEKVCRTRKQIATTPPPMSGGNMGNIPFPIEVVVGGATIFVLDVDEFKKF